MPERHPAQTHSGKRWGLIEDAQERLSSRSGTDLQTQFQYRLRIHVRRLTCHINPVVANPRLTIHVDCGAGKSRYARRGVGPTLLCGKPPLRRRKPSFAATRGVCGRVAYPITASVVAIGLGGVWMRLAEGQRGECVAFTHPRTENARGAARGPSSSGGEGVRQEPHQITLSGLWGLYPPPIPRASRCSQC